jgi:hypothetical protein
MPQTLDRSVDDRPQGLTEKQKDVEIFVLAGHHGAADDVAVATLSAVIQPERVKWRKTDFVVVGNEALYFVDWKILTHDRAHNEDPKTVLHLNFSEDEEAVWWCREEFSTTGITYSPHAQRVDSAPENPFEPGNEFKRDSERKESANGNPVYVIRSGRPDPKAKGQQYKVSFSIGGFDVDPDLYVDDQVG